jgi:ferredoxin
MGTVTFLSMLLPQAVTVPFTGHGRDTLLNLARRHGIPLPCDGEPGCTACQECAVKVAAVRPLRGSTVALTEAEKTALWRVGKLSADQYRARALPAREPLWRVACRYVLGDEHIWVAF